MLRNIAWVVVVVCAALIQTTWPDFLKIQGVTPELVLMLVVYFAIASGEEQSIRTLPSQSTVMKRKVGSTASLTTVAAIP